MVASWRPDRVDGRRRDELRYSVVSYHDLPPVFVDDVMVEAAEQDPVAEGGASAVGVAEDVVSVAPCRR